MTGPCTTCRWFRAVRPASQLLAATFPPTTADVAQALGKVVEDEEKQRDAEADFKRAQAIAGKVEWLGRPVMSAYCGLREADGLYDIAEVRNAGLRCEDHDPAPREPHACRDCVHARAGTAPQADALREETYVDIAARNVSAGVQKDTTDSLLRTHREGASARKALELTGAYQTRGELLNQPGYLAWCEVFSTPDSFSVCVLRNPHHTCDRWEPLAAQPAGPPADEPAARPAPGAPVPETRLTNRAVPSERPGGAMATMDERLRTTIAWLLGTPVPDDVWALVSADLSGSWESLPQDAREQWTGLVEAQEEARSRGPDAWEYLRELQQPAFVGSLRAAHDEASTRLLEVYDRANPPLAPGDPPLTQEVVDSYLGILSFVDALVEGRAWTPLGQDLRAEFTQQMAAQYPSLDRTQQQWLATLPLEWAQTRFLWQAGGENDRLVFRDRLVQAYGATAQATPVLSRPAPSLTMPVIGAGAAPAGTAPTAGSPESSDGIGSLVGEILADQRAEEERLAVEDPELALQVKLQNQVSNATMMSNMLNMRHQASMSIINNIRA